MNWRIEMATCLEQMIPAFSESLTRLAMHTENWQPADASFHVRHNLVAAMRLRSELPGLPLTDALSAFNVIDQVFYQYVMPSAFIEDEQP